jgi:hypothetical protein
MNGFSPPSYDQQLLVCKRIVLRGFHLVSVNFSESIYQKFKKYIISIILILLKLNKPEKIDYEAN